MGSKQRNDYYWSKACELASPNLMDGNGNKFSRKRYVLALDYDTLTTVACLKQGQPELPLTDPEGLPEELERREAIYEKMMAIRDNA